ncbi:MAG: hypothetical protein JNJ73_11570 [Hyphomonadaceae bacterium]|nr:hypothetical protein [Hyphomonadaceae bacterium]
MRKRFLRARRGSVGVMTAVSGVVLVGFAAFATDVGAIYLDARRLQGAADLAAIAAAQNLPRADAAARATLRANGWRNAQVRVETGAYTPDPALRPQKRFAVGAARANAARVEVQSETPLYFGRFLVKEGRMTITRRATAAQSRLASFQIGSRLLSLRGGIANQLLSGLTGSQVNLSVMDYNALVSADVELLAYVDALRTRMNLEAATFGETLQRRIDPPVALEALADVVADRRAETALRQLARSVSRLNAQTGLDRVIDLGPYADQATAPMGAGGAIRVSAMDLAFATLEIANQRRQVQLDLGADVPGLADVDAWLAIGERPNNSPWLAVTDAREVIVRTAQARLYVRAAVGGGASLGLVNVPLLVELASAQAELADVTCGADAASRAVTLSVSPGIGALMLGEIDPNRLDDFKRPMAPTPARLVNAGLVRIDGAAEVHIGGEQWQSLRFSNAEIENGEVKTVATRDAAQATVSSLLRNTKLTVRAGGLALGLASLTAALESVLAAAARPLDELLNGVLDLLGLHLGEADLRVNGVRCGGANLVA